MPIEEYRVYEDQAGELDRITKRIDDATKPSMARTNFTGMRLDESAATHAHAIEFTEGHRECATIAEADNLCSDRTIMRRFKREPGSDSHRIHRSGNFNEQPIHARDPSIGTGALRFFDCCNQSPHE